MKAKKILIVTAHFHPSITPRAFRATALARHFAAIGHLVTVITPVKYMDSRKLEADFKIKVRDIGPLKWKVPAFSTGRIGSLISRAIKRILSLTVEYPDIELFFKLKKILKHEKDYDLLISIAVPHTVHWGVAAARNGKHPVAGTWIADCGDPYMGERTDSFRKLFYFRYVEKWFMRQADLVTIPFEGAREAYYPEFHKKIKVIPQGFDFDEYPSPPAASTPANNKVPTFAYAGSFIPGIRDPRPFLEFLSGTGKDFRVYVFSDAVSLLKPYQEILGDKLIIKKYVPRRELLKFLAGMDFLVNFDNNNRVQLPSKIIDYAVLGKPVLNITNPLHEKTVSNFLSGDYRDAMEIENVEQYRIENVCNKFLESINTEI